MAIPPDIARAYFAAKDGLETGRSPARCDLTFSQFYIETYKPTLGAGKGAKDKIGRVIRFLDQFGNSRLSGIKAEECRRFVADLSVVDELKPATIRKVVIELRLIFRMMMAKGMIKTNPFDEVKLPRVQNQRGVVLPEEKIESFTRALVEFDPYFQSLIWLLLLTGCRSGELLGLKWFDVDLERRVVFLRRTKNGQSRTVALTGAALVEFRKLEQTKVAGNSYVFPGKLPEKPMSRPTKKFVQLCKMAGVEGLWLHDLRRTCATIAARHAPLHTVSRMLGHSSVAVTQRYLVTREDEIANALDGVAACLTSYRGVRHQVAPPD